jgi:hypothetical protein
MLDFLYFTTAKFTGMRSPSSATPALRWVAFTDEQMRANLLQNGLPPHRRRHRG